MFRNCESINNLYVSDFSTKNVKDMSGLFEGCKKLEIIDVSYFETEKRINSKAYEKFLTGKSIGVACSEWVDIIEAGETKTQKSKESVERLLKDIKGKVKNVILGCTHFGLLEDEIKDYLGDVRIINSSTSLKDTVKKCLDEVGYSDNNKQDVKINVTGNPKTLNISWFNEDLDIKGVNIDD